VSFGPTREPQLTGKAERMSSPDGQWRALPLITDGSQ
jgi:hypothetical protein